MPSGSRSARDASLPAHRLRRPRYRRPPARRSWLRGPHDHRHRPSSASDPFANTTNDRPRCGDLGPLHAARGGLAHRPRVLGLGRWQGGRRFRALGRDRTPSSCSTRRRALPYGASVSMDVATERHEHRRGSPSPSPPTRSSDTARRGVHPVRRHWQAIRSAVAAAGRWRQLGRGRDLLPGPDELHPDRRLGHLHRPAAVRVDGTSRRSGSSRISTQGHGRTPRSWPSATIAPTSLAATLATAFARRFPSYRWAENLGCRSGAAGAAVLARTCSSSPRSRTTAATT